MEIIVVGAGVGAETIAHRLMEVLKHEPEILVIGNEKDMISFDDYNRTFSTNCIHIEPFEEWIRIEPVRKNSNQKSPRMSQFIRDKIDAQNRKHDRKRSKKK